MSTNVITWPSIALLHNVIKTLKYYQEHNQQPLPQITYRSKIKLHGTNCAIQRTPHGIVAQSRTTLITPDNDNKGFAQWLTLHQSAFDNLPTGMTVFGEWCGPGIEKGMAISQLNRKVFAVFAIQLGTADNAILLIEPEQIQEQLPQHPDLYVLPWHKSAFSLNYGSDLEQAILVLNQWVESVEQEDPWVKETFGISGLGEGLVLYPLLEATLTPERFATYAFKAKGDKHRTVATKQAVQQSPETASNAQAFAELSVSQGRLEQGVSQVCGGEFQLRHMNALLKWISEDIQKECQAELAASELTWKQVSSAVIGRAREWYKAQSV